LRPFAPVLDEGHDDLEGVGQDGVAVVAALDGLDEDVGAARLDGQAHRVLEHAVFEAALEHLRAKKSRSVSLEGKQGSMF
jgi:hypothetical protein